MNRRSFLRGAVVLAPAVILTPGLLMPVRPLAYVPRWEYVVARLDAQFATLSFWLKASDRKTRELMVNAAPGVTLSDDGRIHLPWNGRLAPGAEAWLDHFRIDTDLWRFETGRVEVPA